MRRKLVVAAAAVAALVGAGTAGGYAYKTILVKKGDVIVLKGTTLGCQVNERDAVTCVKADSTGGKPGTYAVTLTNKGVVVTHFDARRRVKVVFARQHGK